MVPVPLQTLKNGYFSKTCKKEQYKKYSKKRIAQKDQGDTR